VDIVLKRWQISGSRQGIRTRIFRNSKSPRVTVVIPIFNERKTLARVIEEAYKVHPKTEVIVVANGSTDGSKKIARQMGARVISFDFPLGHDVGRSVGAREAKGRIILFTDGDMVISAKEMIPLVRAVGRGVDIALNQYQGPVQKINAHKVVIAKHALNILLSRPDLKGASLTTVPHAISRKALRKIGAEAFAVPPKAQAMAVQKGLVVKAVHRINVGMMNPIRRKSRGRDPVGDLILGDHLEAIHWYIQATNARAKLSDNNRQRQIVR
jgi:glycosyltransferase involved in cell wall biosynthesis